MGAALSMGAIDDLDERFMARALALAAEPSFTSPNPRVGAVVVKDGEVVAEGTHRGAGTPHAEADALPDGDARGAVLYVNLEPCIHHGLTPPCVPSLVAAGVKRVVIAGRDPDPRVAGAGVAGLRAAGIEVTEGVLEAEARRLNAAYLHHRTTGHSFLTLKLALSIDGRLGARDGSSRWISDADARGLVHRRRTEVDAVLVGSGTVLTDDPLLTSRDVPAVRQPIRIVADAAGRVPPTARIFEGEGPVIVATTDRSPHESQIAWKSRGAEVLMLPDDDAGGISLPALVAELGRRGVVEVLCEGGATLATAALRANAVDALEIHTGSVLLGDGGPGLGDLGVGAMPEAARWSLDDVARAGNTIVARYRRDA